MNTEARLRDFILEELNYPGPPTDLTLDFPLLEAEAIDSLGIFALVMFCEDELGVFIEDHELLAENFGSLRSIVELVAAKLDP